VILLDDEVSAYRAEIDRLASALEVVKDKITVQQLLLDTSAIEADASREDIERLQACLDIEEERSSAAGLLLGASAIEAATLRADNWGLTLDLDQNVVAVDRQMKLIERQGNDNLTLKKELEVSECFVASLLLAGVQSGCRNPLDGS